MIDVESLYLEYQLGRGRSVVAIAGLDLRVGRGESRAIIGRSGCGKTSLLYILAGLLPPTRGKVRIGEDEVHGPRRDVALVLQDIGLLPWKSVWRNAILGLELNGRADKARLGMAQRVLEELGLAELKDRFPAQLSGGQKKRVGIARALAVEPQLLLMDEPLVSLDAQAKEGIQNSILQLWQERRERLTMVLVTHDIEEAVFLGERVVVLSQRPAKVKAELENPGMGSVDYRSSSDFYLRAREVRDLL